jgi:hypothetical protein
MITDIWYLEAIGDAIDAPHMADQDELRTAIDAFSDACLEANSRLREAAKLLRNGLRSEAIQISEQEPSLLDFVDELDAVHADWKSLLMQWGRELPPDLEIEIAAELNAAYSELLPLEQLLRKHRLLAIARAPLIARLKVLRQIVHKDNANSSWTADVISYEHARIQQLRDIITQAIAARDLEYLAELREEVNDSSWTSDVPKEFIQDLDAAHQTEATGEALKHLQELVKQIDQAHREMDLDLAIRLRDQWDESVPVANLATDDPLLEAVLESFEWIDQQQDILKEQEAFTQSHNALEDALDRNASQERIETFYHKAVHFGLPMPEVLQQRYDQRIASIKLQAHRKQFLIVATVTVALLLVAVGIGVYWYLRHTEQVLVGHRDKVQELIDNEKWDDTIRHFDTLPPSIQRDPEIESHRDFADGKQEENREREQIIQTSFDKAEKTEPVVPNLHEIQPLVKKLEGLIKPGELHHNERLDRLKDKIAKARHEHQLQVDKRFAETFEAWTKKLAKLKNSEPTDLIDLHQMRRDLAADLAGHPDASNSLRQKGTLLKNELRDIQGSWNQALAEQEAIKAVFKTFGQLIEYQDALQNLVNTHPDTLSATHAQKLIEEEKAWLSVIQWSQYWENQRPWKNLAPGELGVILEDGKDLQGRTVVNPLSEAFEERKEYLTTTANRKNVDTKPVKRFLLQNKLINDVWLVIIADKRYYCPKEPNSKADQWEFEYFVSPIMTRKKKARKNVVEHVGLSPQADFSIECANLFNNLGNGQWDEVFRKASAELCAQNTKGQKIDPILALDMLTRILKTGCEGSYLFHKAFSETVEDIENSNIDLTVLWFLPADEDANAVRQAAQPLFDGLNKNKQFEKQYDAAVHEYKNFCDLPATKIQWVGLLNQRGPNQWSCEPPLPPDTNGTLMIARTGNNDTAELVKVGTVKAGKTTWTPNNARNRLLIATPLFLQTVSPAGN